MSGRRSPRLPLRSSGPAFASSRYLEMAWKTSMDDNMGEGMCMLTMPCRSTRSHEPMVIAAIRPRRAMVTNQVVGGCGRPRMPSILQWLPDSHSERIERR